MTNQLGVTAWTVQWEAETLCRQAQALHLSALHVDLGSAAKGYPLTQPHNQESWLSQAAQHHLEIVALSLNGLCKHGFAFGLSRSEIAVSTMRHGVETARAMGIPAITVPHFFDNAITDAQSLAAAAEALRFLCDLAAEYGKLVYTENVLDHAHLTRLWEQVNRANLRLLFDTQNYAALSSVDAADIFVKWQPFCGNFIHLKDGDGALGNKTLWQGTGDFERVLSTVIASGYEGAMILESNYENAETLRADLGALRARLNEQEDMI